MTPAGSVPIQGEGRGAGEPRVLTSRSERVKQARGLLRRTERSGRGLFLVEGVRSVAEALAEPGPVVEVFATQEVAARLGDLLAKAPRILLADDRAVTSLSETVTPQGLVAVCHTLDVPAAEAVRRPLTAICAEVRDPGNAGTIIRTADAAGAGGVVLTGTSVDPYNPKAVRASVGSLFHLPIAVEPDLAVALAAARAAGAVVLAADGAGELDLFDAVDDGLLDRPTAWLFGNEAHGLPGDVAALADHRVAIPLLGRAESLNLASAAAVCLYASAAAHRSRLG